MNKSQKGQSLFELIMAIGLVGIILLVLVQLATISVRNATSSQNEAEAARLGQEAVEWFRLQRDSIGWDQFVAKTTAIPKICLMGTSWAQAKPLECSANDQLSQIFQRDVEFMGTDTNSDPEGKIDRIEVIIRVKWRDGQGTHTVINSTYFTDWRLQV